MFWKVIVIQTEGQSHKLVSRIISLCSYSKYPYVVDKCIICNKNVATRNLSDLFSKAGFSIEECKLVLIKPNICGLYHPSLELLSAIIRYLGVHAGEVVIGETKSMVHDPKSRFKELGISNLLKRFGNHVGAIDLSDERSEKVKVPKPHVLEKIEFPEIVIKSEVLVNVPRVGTHSTTRITNALKNLFGLLPEKRKHDTYHPLGMDKVIADIAQVIKPDLNVTDAGERVIIGTDPLIVDIVACRFLDLNPLEVGHLKLVSEDRGEKLDDLMEKVRVHF